MPHPLSSSGARQTVFRYCKDGSGSRRFPGFAVRARPETPLPSSRFRFGFCIFTTVSDVKRPEMEDTADGVKMDAGEVTLVNHSSAFRAHLLPHSGFPEDQLALSDQQILPFRQGTLHRAFTGSTSSAAYNPDYHSGMAPCLYSITACPHFFIANTLCLPSRVQVLSGIGMAQHWST